MILPELILAGVVDPVKVTRNALQNAASIASLILTTDVSCVIYFDGQMKGLRQIGA